MLLVRDMRLKATDEAISKDTQSTEWATYTIIQFRYPAIRYRHPRKQHQVHQRVDVAFLREVRPQRASAVISGVLQILHDVSQEWEGSEDTDLLLLRRLYPVLLRCHQVK